MAHILLNIRLILIATIAFFIVNITKTDEPSTGIEKFANNYDFIPLHFDVKLEVNYKNILFGICNIVILLRFPQTKMITINNSVTFAIYEFDLINNNDSQIVNISEFSFINQEYIRINLTKVNFLLSGTYTLKMAYILIISDNRDFFGSLYEEEKEHCAKLMKAAELFPCWDEVLNKTFKTTFNISIRHHKSVKWLSNIPIQEEVTENTVTNMVWTYFYRSPSMFASHLGFMMHTLISTPTSTENVKFWCKPELIDQVRFAEIIAKGVVTYMNKKNAKQITKIDYFIADDIQNDLIIKGFILLRASNIIYDNKLDDNYRKLDVANLIAYQTISHWYEDVALWSKDGFITFLATHILHQTKLYNGIMDLFVVQIQQESLRFDTLPNIGSLPPINVTTDKYSTYHSFRSSFRFIKSSIVWRLFYFLILSEDVFWTSINDYVGSKETNVDNFWNIAQITLNATGNRRKIDIRKLLTSWVTEKSCPEVYVARIDEIEVEMKYLRGQDSNETCPNLVTYNMRSNNRIKYFVLDMSRTFIGHLDFEENDWILVNVQQSGYYRVNYSINNWQDISEYLYHINHTAMYVINRAQIIDDAFYFLMQSQLNYSMFWNITKFLFNDTDYIAWYPMIKAVEYMMCIFPVTQSDYVMNKLQVLFNRLLQNIGYYHNSNDDDHTISLRQEALKWACTLGATECRTIATSELNKDLSNPAQTKLFNWKEWIYCKGLMAANASIWTNVYDRWKKTNDTALLEYLVCIKNPRTASHYLMMILRNDFYVKANIRAYIILLIIARHANNIVALEHILDNLRAIEFSFNRHVDYAVILNVIITHEHSVAHFRKITEFVRNAIREIKILDAVAKKIDQRKVHYYKHITRYGKIGFKR